MPFTSLCSALYSSRSCVLKQKKNIITKSAKVVADLQKIHFYFLQQNGKMKKIKFISRFCENKKFFTFQLILFTKPYYYYYNTWQKFFSFTKTRNEFYFFHFSFLFFAKKMHLFANIATTFVDLVINQEINK